MKPWWWIVAGMVICLVNPVLGAIVTWPGFVLWLAKERDR